MAAPVPTETDPPLLRHVRHHLLKHAIPDSRFHYDFSKFIPDFRDNSLAIDRIYRLPQYQAAKTILVTSDNSLELFRYRALKDGKKLLVSTHGIKRGYVLLDARRIGDDRLEFASCVDGMERPGIGRNLSLVQMQEENISVDLFVTGILSVDENGTSLWEGPSHTYLQWLMLFDRNVIAYNTPIVGVAHECQVVEGPGTETSEAESKAPGSIQHDFIATPERLLEIEKAHKPDKQACETSLERIHPDTLNQIPPLQELMGMKMMEKIMKGAGVTQFEKPAIASNPTADEQMGIDMVEQLMRGYKA